MEEISSSQGEHQIWSCLGKEIVYPYVIAEEYYLLGDRLSNRTLTMEWTRPVIRLIGTGP